MSVADSLKKAGYRPHCSQVSPNVGNDETRSTCVVPVVPTVPGDNTEGEAKQGEALLLVRCREICQGLPISRSDLMAELNEAAKAAQCDGPEGLGILRTAAKCMAERVALGLTTKNDTTYS